MSVSYLRNGDEFLKDKKKGFGSSKKRIIFVYIFIAQLQSLIIADIYQTIFLFIVLNGTVILKVINIGQNMHNQIFYIITLFILSLEIVTASDNAIQFLDSKSDEYAAMSNTIWTLAELGYQEEKTSKLMQSHLKEESFSINAGVAEIPTAFIASYGSGKPIIAILAEMDALPVSHRLRHLNVRF